MHRALGPVYQVPIITLWLVAGPFLWVELCSQKACWKPSLLVPRHVALFGSRVFADIIKMRSYSSYYGTPTFHGWCP